MEIGWAELGVRWAGLEERDPKAVDSSSMREREEGGAEPGTAAEEEDEILP